MDVDAVLNVIALSPSKTEKEEQRRALSAYLNHLLLHDFAALVQALYRADVSEERLKSVLKQNPRADAGDLLAELLLQRQQEKIVARQTFAKSTARPPEDEAW